jgi:Asp-tRNA(Asn)/Glu-tRNA(Gln) amidotransferase A subunit family amidase
LELKIKFAVCVLRFLLLEFFRFDVKGYVPGFGNPEWKKTHEEAEKTAIVVTALLFNGATCVGKTVMDEFSFG